MDQPLRSLDGAQGPYGLTQTVDILYSLHSI